MTKGKRGSAYDDDDFDDGDYDDYEDYEDAPVPVPKPKINQPPAPAPKAAPTTPKPSGGPSAAAVKKASAATAQAQQPFPAVPQQDGMNSSQPQRFQFDTPSPDEAVLAAQQGKPTIGAERKPATSGGMPTPLVPRLPAHAGTSKAKAAAADAASTSGVGAAADGFANLGLRDGGAGPQSSAAPARRPLSEFVMDADLAREVDALAAAERLGRPSLHLVVLGHVDAGKSTLMGRLLHDLGFVSQKEVHKHQKEATQLGKASFAWAFVLDERPEERARGVTVDVAVTHFQTPRFMVTLLDAPGHRDFVPAMISGAAQADAALLLVDGSPGGFEAGFEAAAMGESSGGQTREHAQLARSLGVEQLAVVVSKLDTCDYSQARFDSIRALLLPFLKTCGFREDKIQMLPAVGPLGENLATPPALGSALAAWWQGPTLVQAIDVFDPRERNTGRPLRLPISDVFKARQGGTAVGGKVEAGALKPGMQLLVVPSNEHATVRSIEVDGSVAAFARAGDSVDVTLSGIDAEYLSPGAVLCTPDFPARLARRFEARVVVLDVPVPVLQGQQVTLHAHAAREAGHISTLLAILNRNGETSKARPRRLAKGETAVIEVRADRPLCLEEYGDFKPLGRIALRDAGRTIAVGIVTKILE